MQGSRTARGLALVIACETVMVREIVEVCKTFAARGACSNLVVRLTRNAALSLPK